MLLRAVNPETGEAFKAEIPDGKEEEIRDFLKIDLSDEAVKRKINNLDLSADAKSWLFTVTGTTIRVGETVFKVGKKILSVVFDILSKFPNMAAGTLICTVLSLLISSIPIIGFMLGSFLAPLLIAFGIVLGTLQDIKDQALKRQIIKTVADFDKLKTTGEVS